MSSYIRIPAPINEPVHSFAPNTPERAALKAELDAMKGRQMEIPLVIGGREVRTGRTAQAVMPHDHGHVLATWHRAGHEEVRQAVEAAREAHAGWVQWPWEDRAAVFLRAAELLATHWRPILNASTMLGQSKTAFQAEIDAAAEMIDFFRFNVHFAERLYQEQPVNDRGIWNRMEYRPLEGFVYAITPFNFTSIGGNLPTAPALMGNTVIWKPASTAVYSNYFMFKLLEEAGLPPGVINFLPGDAGEISEVLLRHPDLAGIHFTGSTAVFQDLWRLVGENIGAYRSYPRLVGETGGKDFIVAHMSADPRALVTAAVRGAFEYQGQKCSAASRMYVPESLWRTIGDELVGAVEQIPVGDVTDFRNFMGAVIDQKAFRSISGYVEHAQNGHGARVIAGGKAEDKHGWFIHPTVIQAERADYRSMCEEIFGPVLSVHVYPDGHWGELLEVVDRTSPYGLTGAVFADDRRAVRGAMEKLRFAAGNFYINDKPTGAVVGQQPFGGARASGTNDKAGSMLNLVRWVSARSIKENFAPPRDWRYPFMDAK